MVNHGVSRAYGVDGDRGGGRRQGFHDDGTAARVLTLDFVVTKLADDVRWVTCAVGLPTVVTVKQSRAEREWTSGF